MRRYTCIGTMSLNSPAPYPTRNDVERDPQSEALLKRLRTSYWQNAEFLYNLAKDRRASFEGLEESEAVQWIRGCLVEISLCLEQRCRRERVSSFKVERTDTDVQACFDGGSLDLSNLVGVATRATNRLSPEDSRIVSGVIIDQLFHDEIGLPGFARDVVDGDTLIFTLLPADAQTQLQYRGNSKTQDSLAGGNVRTAD